MRRESPLERFESTAEDTSTPEDFLVLVAVANPATESHLIRIATAMATLENGRIRVISVVKVPDQTSLEAAREGMEYQDSKDLVARANGMAADTGVSITAHVVFSHYRFRAVFDAAREHDADLCIMGWGENAPGVSGRSEPLIAELAHSLPCDLLVFKDRGFDPAKILLPTTGGPHTDLAARVARAFEDAFGSEITLLHVEDDLEKGRGFLDTWAAEHGLGGAGQRIKTGSVESAISSFEAEHTMILIGAAETGVLARLVGGSLTLEILHEVGCSVLIAETTTQRGLFERIFRLH